MGDDYSARPHYSALGRRLRGTAPLHLVGAPTGGLNTLSGQPIWEAGWKPVQTRSNRLMRPSRTLQ
jgi:hypothetical protein